MLGNPIGYPIGGIEANEISGILAVTLDDVTIAATGVLPLAAAAAILLDEVAPTATGTVAIVGTETALLDDCTLVSFAEFTFDNITTQRQTNKGITTLVPAYQTITTPRVNNAQITA